MDELKWKESASVPYDAIHKCQRLFLGGIGASIINKIVKEGGEGWLRMNGDKSARARRVNYTKKGWTDDTE